MGIITYQSVSDFNPSLDDIFAGPRRQVSLGPNSFRQEVVGGPWDGCQISYVGQNFKDSPDDTFPSGAAMVQQVTISWQGETLFRFLGLPFIWLSDIVFKSGITAVENVLQGTTYGGPNTFEGNTGSDRLTTYRAGDTLNGGGGDDRFWGRIGGTILHGQAGNDTFVATASDLSVNGSVNAELGLAETDSLEIHGLNISFAAIANVDVLRFVDNGDFVNRSTVLRADQIGDGLLSKTLHVEGAAGIANRILVERPLGGGTVQIDLSGWTFDAGWLGSAFRVELTFNEGATPFDDTVTGTGKDDLIRVGNGANILRGGLGADKLNTGAGDDLFLYGAGEAAPGELINAGGGIDTIEVRGDNDFSTITLRSIERLRFAGEAKVTLGAGIAPLEVTGDDHVNRLGFTFFQAGRLDLSSWAFNDWGASDEIEISSSSGDDEIVLKAGIRASVEGGAGNDILTGADGDDCLDGGSGADSMTGGSGDDTYIVDNIGDVVVEAMDGGTDAIRASVTITLADFVNKLVLTGTGAIDGTGNGLDNEITGNAAANVLNGSAGADTLQGGDGIDTAVFSGGRANYVRTVDQNGLVTLADQRMNGDGTDLLSGIELFQFVDRTYTLAELLNNAPTGIALESGLILENSEPEVSVGTLSVVDDAGPHTYSLLSDAGGRFILDGDEIVYTGQGSLDYEQASSYVIRVKAEDSFGSAVEKDLTIVVGDETSERATGTTQADTMWGGAGDDTFDGLAGNDLLRGGGGRDALTGGRGKDVFAFDNGDTGSSKARADTILDFKGREGDRIDLKAVDGNTKKGSDQAFSFIGTKAFTKTGQVRYEKTKTETYVYLNTDSDKAVEAVIRLKGAMDLQKSWFVL
ncbi:calcium-binding protein [Microvirga sp. CF3062]|uniref:calcium-binding protein n=1 Tax=Microvirga sp. CF3062 TaxID=3110182 RepID=UPI002E759F7E|nr:calcium-binding protein [Microvirga sp. CF3062]MEE1656971.1 calcium-binding protein [Microvirga sp. CF3062]